MAPRTLGYFSLVAAVAAFSLSGVLAKVCSAPALTIAFWVRAFSLSFLAVVLLVQNGRQALPVLRAAGRHSLAGGVLFALHIVCYFSALKLTSVTVVFLMGALDPAVVALFAWVTLGERPSRRQAFWTAVAIAAAAAVVLARDAEGEVQLGGNLIAVVSALLYCAYFLASRSARRFVGATEYMTVVTLVSLLAVGGAMLVLGTPFALSSSRDVTLIALLALIPATVGHLSVSWALRHVEAHAAATILLAVPLFASFWAYVFVDERLSAAQIAAGIGVLLAIPGAIRPSTPAIVAIPTDVVGELGASGRPAPRATGVAPPAA